MVNWGGGWRAVPVACAIEMALWDLIGKAAGLPLYKLWGAHTDRVRAYASLVELRSPEQRAEDALRLLEQGYRAIKLRLHAPTMKEDIAQVEAVRLAVGDRMEIMVDANQAQEPGTPGSENDLVWSYDRALATCRELAPLDVAWLEEPLGRYDVRRPAPPCRGQRRPDRRRREQRRPPRVPLADRPGVLRRHPAGRGRRRRHRARLRKIAAYAELRHKQFAPHHGGSGIGRRRPPPPERHLRQLLLRRAAPGAAGPSRRDLPGHHRRAAGSGRRGQRPPPRQTRPRGRVEPGFGACGLRCVENSLNVDEFRAGRCERAPPPRSPSLARQTLTRSGCLVESPVHRAGSVVGNKTPEQPRHIRAH